MSVLKKYQKVLLRFCGIALIGLIVFSVEQCDAQIIRGRWQRANSIVRDVNTKGDIPVRAGRQAISNVMQGTHTTNRFSERWGRLGTLNVQDNDARYIGGLHRTYFQNLGIPSGDIGLRGNGVIWRPW